MTNHKLAPKAQAHQHVLAALATGVRGELRDALREAERLSSPTPTSRTLTDLHYKNLPPGQKLLDPDRSGFLMRHGKRSGKVWVFRYACPNTGKQKEHQFGTYPSLSLTEAREQWADLRIARNRGGDPAQMAGGKLHHSSTTVTIATLVEKFVEEYAKAVKRSWAEDERLLHRLVVPKYGHLVATDFTHIEATELLACIHMSGATRMAEKVRAVLSTMFNVAVGKTRKISTLEGTWLPPTTPNPVEGVLLPKRIIKNHKPTRQELAGFLRGLGVLPNGAVLRFQALTMTRVSEATGISWGEVDLDEGRWVLPAARAKNSLEHVVMLSTQALNLLTVIKAEQEAKYLVTDSVFPSSRIPSQSVSANYVQNQLAGARAGMGLRTNFKTHSLRHAALTWAAEHGCPRDVRDRLTNHVSGGGVDAIYNGAALNRPAREWWQRWADYLDEVEAPSVVPLHARRKRA